MKLWQKTTAINDRIEAFTVGQDRDLDVWLAPFDVLGSLAHAQMLGSIGLLETSELESLRAELIKLYHKAEKRELIIEEGIEDVHSQVELMLTQQLGDVGKKIHSGRSRNDQVLVDTKMYLRWEIEETLVLVSKLFHTLQALSEQHKDKLMPGYTHLQVAMPSSFGLWFGAYAESLSDDVNFLKAAFEVVNQNPLGSAAGYGSSFPLDRQMTSDLLGFSAPNYNTVYAQMTRGKSEKAMATAMSYLAGTLGKMSMDICLYMGQNYGFLTFPDELTTGSSIMPHKKNPDVFELVRARCNELQALPNTLTLTINNLPSGYHRDLQLLKEELVPAIQNMKSCLEISEFMLQNIIIKESITEADTYDYLFTVEEVNKLVLEGAPFRDAYKQVGAKVESGEYQANREVNHSHLGSIGNLGNELIAERFQIRVEGFGFEKVNKALMGLIDN
ncbi:MAG: argininosuccinate lyase [Cyclobacteriaceae bacterium]